LDQEGKMVCASPWRSAKGPTVGVVWAVFIMVRGHFLGGYLCPDIVTWILHVCLDDSYHVAPTVCQADDYPLRGRNG
jgi:hypothetical protein